MQKVEKVRFFSARGLVMLGAGILLVVVLLLLTPEGSKAATITVDDDGPADYSKIQDAINASIDGDTVFVYNGTYYENVWINKMINLTGENRNTTTIDGGWGGDVVLVSVNWVNVSSFTITHTGNDWDDAGIKLNNSQNCRVINNNVSNNYDGVYLSSSSNNTITCNNVSNNKMGIYLMSSLNNTIIWNNVSNKYYGIYLRSSSNNTITCNNVSNNYNGFILHLSSNNTIIFNNISNNHDGVHLYLSSNNAITGNNVSNNVCGIGLLSSSNSNLITCNNVLNNEYGINISSIISSTSNNKVYHNNLISNVNQAHDDTNNDNQWDNGYPSGGNYWDDYIGIDSFGGPNQDIPGNDGIGDTNYIIKFNGQDNYPLMSWANEIRTAHNYDGSWHNSNFTITLITYGGEGGTNHTYYRINDGPLEEIALDGQPHITTESDNNTLEYWSVDNASNEETHRFLYSIKLDKTPPSTSDDYDSLWHNTDFTITITTFEETSGINETYYRLNSGPIKMVSTDGQPFITTENDNNTLEYWSIDNVSNEETHKFLYNIKLDKTIPSTSDDYDDLWYIYDFTIRLIAFDEESGVNETYYRINGGSIKMVSIDGHPFVTTENDNITLEYWSIDNASNEESHKFLYNIKLDKAAPSTLDDYDDLWHYLDFVINLIATDGLSGINDTFYRINNDNIKSVTDDGQPLITTEGENNTLEYWSKDIAGNIEEYHIVYGIKLNKTYPDFMISLEDITFSGPRLIEASEVYLNATIHNIGNLSASATIKFYDGNPNIGLLIGSKTITVAAHDSNLVSVLWNTTLGNHNIYVLIENSVPEEPFAGNNIANKSVIVEVPPVLVLSVGDINVFRFESGEERTVPVYVSSYNNSAINVRLVVLDDRGLNITVVTPPQNISKDGSFTFYLRIKAPVLKENQEYREEDILIQVISDETTSNEEFMDVIVGRAAAELFWWFVLLGGATTGAGALGFLGGTEIGKYALFAAAMSLYTRLTRKDIEDQETRGMIRGYILANPGEHYNAIKRALGLKNGNLAYHLKKLEKESLIKSTRDGRYKRFYPPSMKIPEDVFTLNKIQEIILGEIIKAPGISQKGLSETVGLSTSTINYHIGVMANSGFVRIERKGKHTMCYPGNGVA